MTAQPRVYSGKCS